MSDKLTAPVKILSQFATWRLAILGDGSLVLQRLEAGGWVTKDTWS